MPDPQYQTFPFVLASRGIVARYVVDEPPPGSYLSLLNCEVRQENSMSSRMGVRAITTNGANANFPFPETNIHTLGRLKSLNDANSNAPVTYRYGATTNLYRRATDTQGQYTALTAGAPLSGQRMGIRQYRPDISSLPWAFFADKNVMLKDNGTLGTAQQMGYFPPTSPCTAVVQQPATNIVDPFSVNTFTVTNLSATSIQNRVNTTLGTAVVGGQISTVHPTAMTNILVGELLSVDAGGLLETVVVLAVTKTTFDAYFVNSHTALAVLTNTFLQGNVAANTIAKVSKSVALDFSVLGGGTADDNDVFNLFLNISDPSSIVEARLYFDVGDGSFTKDYYYKSIAPASFQAAVTQSTTTAKQFTNRVYNRASGNTDMRRLGFRNDTSPVDLLPTDDPYLPQLRAANLGAGLGQWSQIQIKRSEMVPIGRAGVAGFDWASVNGWQVTIQTVPSASTTVGIDDLYFGGGAGPDSFAGSSYDYRATFYNINTGGESNPNPTMISTQFVSPRRQPVKLALPTTTDGQYTHTRIYRRGGGLNTGWYYVDQVAVNTVSYTDTLSDSVLSAYGQLLTIDNDPPVTSTLRAAVNTTLGTAVTAGSLQTVTPASIANIFAYQKVTIGAGSTQEVVYVQSVDSVLLTFTAYFQYAHASSDVVAATARIGKPCSIFAVEFDCGWLAGDTDNPHMLYQSKRFNVEVYPPENQLEVGKPDDPIMGIWNVRSQLYVATQTTIYNIIGANIPGAGLFPVATGIKYGMTAPYAYVIVDDVCYYKSYNGVYGFQGSSSPYGTEAIEWLFNNQAYGPIVPIDTTKDSTMSFEFFSNEVFIAYTATDGTRNRLIWHTIYKRWRNDNVAAVAMLMEPDVSDLVISKADGMIYQDRVLDYDNGGWDVNGQIINPIVFTMQSVYQDQQRNQWQKVYQNLLIDADTAGQDTALSMAFDNGATGVLVLITNALNSNGRSKIPFSIRNGLGQEGYNMSLLWSGSVTQAATLFEVGVEAAVEAKIRTSFDTYWLNFGTPQYKLVKQGWIEYKAPDPAGVTLQVYIEGSTVPIYTRKLASCTQRTATRLRFPAFKAKTWRFIFTSPSKFQLYEVSFLETKPVCASKGYGKATLQTAA